MLLFAAMLSVAAVADERDVGISTMERSATFGVLQTEPEWVNEPDPPKPVEPLSEEQEKAKAERKKEQLEARLALGSLAVFGIGLAVTTGVGSVVDQNGDFGRVASTAAAAFGLGSLVWAITTVAVTAAIMIDALRHHGGFIDDLLTGIFAPVFGFLAGMVLGTAALIGGAVLGAAVSQQPGVPRATMGVLGSSVLGAVSISMLGFAIAI